MKKIGLLVLLVSILCQAGPDLHAQVCDNWTSLEGKWKFRMDSLDKGLEESWCLLEFDEEVQLPGSMTENGKGQEINLETPWTGGIVDRSYFTDDPYEKYRT